jgi:hypothetical protein
LLRWWAGRLARRFRRAGMLVNDAVVGLAWSGAFDAARMRRAMAGLRDGLVEIYCHPASEDGFPGAASGYRYRDELGALLDAGVRSALVESGAVAGRFADFASPVASLPAAA